MAGIVRLTSPRSDVLALLPSADFADAYRLVVDDSTLDAPEATRRVLRFPAWVRGLMAVRNLFVAPFRLKRGVHPNPSARRWIGQFPVISETPERVVLGFDDRHLDFLLVVDVSDTDDRAREVTATTLVETHNLFGRIYLDAVMPFHRRIVPALLAQAAAA